MTPSERERRIEAAAAVARSEDEHDPTWSIPKPLRLAEKMLDAAEEAVPVVDGPEVEQERDKDRVVRLRVEERDV